MLTIVEKVTSLTLNEVKTLKSMLDDRNKWAHATIYPADNWDADNAVKLLEDVIGFRALADGTFKLNRAAVEGLTAAGDSASSHAKERPEPIRRLAAVVTAYDDSAPHDLHTTGSATHYRKIRPVDWPRGANVHYEFLQRSGDIGVELHLENEKAGALRPQLEVLDGQLVGGTALEWEPTWYRDTGRLRARFPMSAKPEDVAKAMDELIGQTRKLIAEQLSARRPS